jgi:hypothetical protein
MEDEKIYFWGVKKEKIGFRAQKRYLGTLQSSKTKYGAEGKIHFWVQKGENKPSKPKNRILAPKSV